jgi:carbon starvation protein
VIPSVGLVPTAIAAGWLLYVRKMGNGPVTVLGLGALALLLWAGTRWHVSLPDSGFFPAETLWIFLLLAYCFAASVLPVQFLLQPRDYLASFVLFAMILVGLAGTVLTRPDLTAPAWKGFLPAGGTGPLWPMLFVTIACGAISGFHALVSSGTTCKQIGSEAHCMRVGYGGMLVESLVGVLVLIAVAAGLRGEELSGHLGTGGPIAAFSHGYRAISFPVLGEYGKAFAVLALNAFILTTLDTATRIARYLTAELFGLRNKYVATLAVVTASGALALSGHWNLLWPAFGTANQLIAAITLLIASCWLLNRGANYRLTLFPALLLLVTTVAAFLYQIFQALTRRNPATGASSPDWIVAAVAVVLTLVAFSILAEAWKALQGRRISGAKTEGRYDAPPHLSAEKVTGT